MSSEDEVAFGLDVDLMQSLQELNDEDLAALANLHEEEYNDAQAELCVAAAFYLFTRTKSLHHLQKLVAQTGRWLNAIPSDHSDHSRRSQIFDAVKRLKINCNCNTPQVLEEPENAGSSSKLQKTSEGCHLSASSVSTRGQPEIQSRLDAYIEAGENFVQTQASPSAMSSLSALLCERFESKRSQETDVHRAAELSRQAMELTDCTDINWVATLSNYAVSLRLRSQIAAINVDSVRDLDLAIDLLRMILFPDVDEQMNSTVHSIEHPLRARLLTNLGDQYQARFRQTHEVSDLEQAIEMGEMAVALTDNNESCRLVRLDRLQQRLVVRIQHLDQTTSGDVADNGNFDGQTRETQRRWFDRLCAIGDTYLHHILKHSKQTPLSHVNMAIQLAEFIEGRLPPEASKSDLDAIYWTRRRSLLLMMKFKLTRRAGCIDAAISLERKAHEHCPQPSPYHRRILNTLSAFYIIKFEHSDSPSIGDLDRALEYRTKALEDEYPTDGQLDSSRRLEGLANCFLVYFKLTSNDEYVAKAVELSEMAFEMAPEQSSDALPIMQTLAVSLETRSRSGCGDPLSDSTRAYEIFRDVMERTPRDSPDFLPRTHLFDGILEQHYKTAGSPEHVNHAISLLTELMENVSSPADHPIHGLLRQAIVPWLRVRSSLTHSAADLAQAVNMLERVTSQAHEGDSSLSDSYGNLAIALMHEWHRTGEISNVNRAIEKVMQSIKVTSENSPKMSRRWSLLASLRMARWQACHTLDDLESALEMAELSLRDSHQLRQGLHKAELLSNLAVLLETRSKVKHRGFISDLDYAAELFEAAIDAGGRLYRFRASMLTRLINIIHRRLSVKKPDDKSPATDIVSGPFRRVRRFLVDSSRTMGSTDLDRALSAGKRTLDQPSCSVSDRLELAMVMIEMHAESRHWEDADSVCQAALLLLPRVSPRSLDNKEKSIARFAGLTASAASICLEVGKDGLEALKCLERGRGIINGLLFETRGDISTLKEAHPELAADFASIRERLDLLETSQTQRSEDYRTQEERQASLLRATESSFNEKLAEIRSLPGFQDFLAVPSAQDMVATAASDPIAVINVSKFRCDALLIRNGTVDILQLPDLNILDAQDWAEQLQTPNRSQIFRHISPFLEWLWKAICLPILDALGFCHPISGDDWPRIWWIPTGIVSRFPLHAAGLHMKPGKTVLDRVMSSYASSVRSLAYARNRGVANMTTSESEARALLVEMSHTPHHVELPEAAEEVRKVEELCPSLGLVATTLTTVSRKSEVLHHIGDCHLFHFAGHGSLDANDPLKSSLLLHDWKDDALAIADLRSHRLEGKSHFLCYLSACSTGATGMDALSDEGVHFINAFQTAGFRHVIGTLWSVVDKTSRDLAEKFYQGFEGEKMTDEGVCRALHRAIRILRDKGLKFDESGQGAGSATQSVAADDSPGADTTSECRAKVKSIAVLKEDGPGFTVVYEGDASESVEAAKGNSQRNLGEPSHWVPFVHYGV